jgi:hypothetical protein
MAATPPMISMEGYRSGLKLLKFSELKSTTALYLVKGLFPRKGVVIVWGSQCSKSF